MTQLSVAIEPYRGGHRYVIREGGRELIASGPFHLEADARRCGEHVASDPKGLHDFLER